jgi:hypothetical protein
MSPGGARVVAHTDEGKLVMYAIPPILGAVVGSLIAAALISWAWGTISGRPLPPIDWDRFGGPTS